MTRWSHCTTVTHTHWALVNKKLCRCNKNSSCSCLSQCSALRPLSLSGLSVTKVEVFSFLKSVKPLAGMRCKLFLGVLSGVSGLLVFPHVAGNQVDTELQLNVWKITQNSEQAAVLTERELGIFRPQCPPPTLQPVLTEQICRQVVLFSSATRRPPSWVVGDIHQFT